MKGEFVLRVGLLYIVY